MKKEARKEFIQKMKKHQEELIAIQEQLNKTQFIERKTQYINAVLKLPTDPNLSAEENHIKHALIKAEMIKKLKYETKQRKPTQTDISRFKEQKAEMKENLSQGILDKKTKEEYKSYLQAEIHRRRIALGWIAKKMKRLNEDLFIVNERYASQVKGIQENKKNLEETKQAHLQIIKEAEDFFAEIDFPFHCPVCYKGYQSESFYKKHLDSHPKLNKEIKESGEKK